MKLKHILQGRFLPHPLHPAMVHIPMGLWIASFIFDIAALSQGSPDRAIMFTTVSYYCIWVGVVGGLLAATSGLAEYVDITPGTIAQKIAFTHMVLNIALLLGYVLQIVMRQNLFVVSMGVFFFNLIEVVVLGASGYTGGRLAYEYRIGTREGFEEPVQEKRAA